jgi:phenol hydroxylase P3 protein
MMAIPTIRLKDPTRFEDPFSLTYNKYIKTQYDRVRLHETVTGPHRDKGNDERLDPQYITFAKAMTTLSYGGEYSAYVYCTKASHLAPFRSFREACSYQAMDELRHSQMDWGRLRDLGCKDSSEVMDLWHSEGLAHVKRAFDSIVALEDPFQIIFTANFIFEGAAASSFFPGMVELSKINGDHISSTVHWTRYQDEVRHVAFARALVKAIVDDDDRNIKILELWQEAAFESLGPAVLQGFGYNDLFPIPLNTSTEWLMDGMIHYGKQAEKVGLELPDIEAILAASSDVESSLEALNTGSGCDPSWWEDGLRGAGALEQPPPEGPARSKPSDFIEDLEVADGL